MSGPWWKISKAIITVFIVAGMLGLIFMLVLTVANITLRELFSAPIYGSIEMIGFAGVVMYSSSIVYCQIQRRQVVMRVLIDRLSSRVQRVLEIISSFLVVISVVILGVAAFIITQESIVKHEITDVLVFHPSPFRATWAFCCVLLFGIVVYQIYTMLSGRGRK